jgi:hypothetical protein
VLQCYSRQKRLCLIFLFAELFNLKVNDILGAICTLNYLYSDSLAHECWYDIDNNDLNREMITHNKKFDEATLFYDEFFF